MIAVAGSVSHTARLHDERFLQMHETSLHHNRQDIMRWRHDHRRSFKLSVANASRLVASDPLCGSKLSKHVRADEWIRGRSNDRGRNPDRLLLLLGRLLPQRNSRVLLWESMMKHRQICDHCGGRFGMVTYRWWGNRFCKRMCKAAYLREIALSRNTILDWCGLPRRG